MLKLVIGFCIGYWLAYNKETVKKYYDIFINWVKEKINKKSNNEKSN